MAKKLFQDLITTKDVLEENHKHVAYPPELVELVEKFLDFNKGDDIEAKINEEMESLLKCHKCRNFSEVTRLAKRVSDLSKDRADMRVDGIDVRENSEVTLEDVTKAFEKFWIGRCYGRYSPIGKVDMWRKIKAVKLDIKSYGKPGFRLIGPTIIVDSGCDGLPNLDLRPAYAEYIGLYRGPGNASIEISNEEFEGKFKKAISICNKIYIDEREA